MELQKYNIPVKNVEVNFKPVTVNVDGSRISLTDSICKNIQNPGFQKQLMRNYIQLKGFKMLIGMILILLIIKLMQI